MWARGEHATTPYFGIWNKSAAKIGNPIAYPQATLSALSPETTPAKQNDISPASESLSVGAFAYRIEATESLSQLTSFFLQQPVNFYDRQQISNWLTRFKELDLRLVQYGSFLYTLSKALIDIAGRPSSHRSSKIRTSPLMKQSSQWIRT
jgi:hypothetical protein